MKKKYLLIFILLGIIVIFSVCHSKRNAKDNSKKIFRFNSLTAPSSLDPAFAYDIASAWIDQQLYNGLVQFDNKLNILPCIAKRWEISEDGMMYTFHLRNDVYFHDNKVFKNGKGRKVKAADFAYSFNRIVDPAVASPGLWIFSNVKRNEDKSYAFYAKDDSTFVINLNQCFSPFISILTMPYCSVVPKEIVEYYKKDFRRNPVGTGPFMLSIWKEGLRLNLEKNTNYFEYEGKRRLPFLDGISVSFVIDNQSVLFDFLKGNLDFISGNLPAFRIALLDKNNNLKPEYANKFKYITGPYLNTEFLGFNIDKNIPVNKNNPLLIKEVRQAINYAIDRKMIVKHLRYGIGIPATKGFIPEDILFSEKNINYSYEYNPGKAAELLKKAGFPGGKGMPEIDLYTTSYYSDICQYIQNQLSEIGINMKIEVNQAITIQDMTTHSKVNFFKIAWIADYPDAENFLSVFYSKNFNPNGPNYFHFLNKKYDELFEESQKEFDLGKRITYYKEMEKIIFDESPVVNLYYDKVVRFTQKNISGLGSNPMNSLDLKRVEKKTIVH